MHNHTACCPYLNSRAQPWPLPDFNHSPGTVMFNSSLTTKSLSHFLTGQDDEPHLPFQGAESMFTTTREAINWRIRALLFKVSCYSFTVGEGLGYDLSSQGLQSLGLGLLSRREMPAGPRGQQVQQWEQLLPLLTLVHLIIAYYFYTLVSQNHTEYGSILEGEIVYSPGLAIPWASRTNTWSHRGAQRWSVEWTNEKK